jgi:hypothetical protein
MEAPAGKPGGETSKRGALVWFRRDLRDFDNAALFFGGRMIGIALAEIVLLLAVIGVNAAPR